jgi:hydrogenase maturation protease
MKTLLIGYGNPGRRDDGLGAALADAIEARHIGGVTTDADYQLNIEYAADIQTVDKVIFADASENAAEPFEFKSLSPADRVTFTTHSVSPESVLAGCQDLLGHAPEAHVLAIRGYSFEMQEGLTEQALSNLAQAVKFLSGYLSESA